MKILLERGADVKQTDHKGWTALLWAAYYGLDGVVQQLLAHGADIAATSRNQRWTALHLAAEKDCWDTVRTLLNGGANVMARTRDGKTALDVVPKLYMPTKSLLQKAMEEAIQIKQTRDPPTLYEIRSNPMGDNAEIIPRELSKFIPKIARERIHKVWASPRQRPSALYDTKEFLERTDNLLSQHAFRQLIQQARDAPLNSNGDKVSSYCLYEAVPG